MINLKNSLAKNQLELGLAKNDGGVAEKKNSDAPTSPVKETLMIGRYLNESGAVKNMMLGARKRRKNQRANCQEMDGRERKRSGVVQREKSAVRTSNAMAMRKSGPSLSVDGAVPTNRRDVEMMSANALMRLHLLARDRQRLGHGRNDVGVAKRKSLDVQSSTVKPMRMNGHCLNASGVATNIMLDAKKKNWNRSRRVNFHGTDGRVRKRDGVVLREKLVAPTLNATHRNRISDNGRFPSANGAAPIRMLDVVGTNKKSVWDIDARKTSSIVTVRTAEDGARSSGFGAATKKKWVVQNLNAKSVKAMRMWENGHCNVACGVAIIIKPAARKVQLSLQRLPRLLHQLGHVLLPHAIGIRNTASTAVRKPMAESAVLSSLRLRHMMRSENLVLKRKAIRSPPPSALLLTEDGGQSLPK